jgi:uncharacterized protein (DUF433 family)
MDALSDYLTVVAPDDIRIKGTRVGIETVLYDFIHRGLTPEVIAEQYPSLTLEQVYATITYYLHDRERVAAYLANWLEQGRQRREARAKNPPPVVARLRRAATQRHTPATKAWINAIS